MIGFAKPKNITKPKTLLAAPLFGLEGASVAGIGLTKKLFDKGDDLLKSKEPDLPNTAVSDAAAEETAAEDARRKARVLAAQQQAGGRGGALLASGGASSPVGRKRSLLGA